jgi:hypothetical protein
MGPIHASYNTMPHENSTLLKFSRKTGSIYKAIRPVFSFLINLYLYKLVMRLYEPLKALVASAKQVERTKTS